MPPLFETIESPTSTGATNQTTRRVPGRRAFLFDLGCSTYNAGLGGASQSWFVEKFRSHGIEFDRILAWEAMNHVSWRVQGLCVL